MDITMNEEMKTVCFASEDLMDAVKKISSDRKLVASIGDFGSEEIH